MIVSYFAQFHVRVLNEREITVACSFLRSNAVTHRNATPAPHAISALYCSVLMLAICVWVNAERWPEDNAEKSAVESPVI